MSESIYNVQDWSINTNYQINDIVFYNNNYYYCIADHNSALAFSDIYWSGVINYNGKVKPYFFWKPSYNSSVIPKPRVKTVQFGDGYRMTSDDGINNVLLTLELIFDLRAESQARAILHFLNNMRGSKSFVFTPPNPYNQNKLFLCQDFPSEYLFIDNFTIKCTFEEVPV